MDYEEILFGLQPILNASSIKDVPMNDVYLGSYLAVMDQLAVSLREPSNRDIVGKTGLLLNLVRVLEQALDICFHDTSISNNDKIAFYEISSEVIRCIANAIIDNDDNREILLDSGGKKLLNYYIGGVLQLDEISSDKSEDSLVDKLQMRSVVLLRNFCIGNLKYTENLAPFIRGPLFVLLKTTQYSYLSSPEKVVLGSDLLNDILKVNYSNVQISDLFFLSQYIKKISSNVQNKELQAMEDGAVEAYSNTETQKFAGQGNQEYIEKEEEDDEEDVNCELLLNLSTCLETIVAKDETINFTNEEQLVLSMQKNLILSLVCLESKTFNNKLIVMRRLISCAGNISANLTNSNKREQSLCIETIKSSASSYALAAALMILCNSVASKSDAVALLKLISLSELIQVGSLLQDPLQYQGFLDLLRKLLNLENAMWLDIKDLFTLFQIMRRCHEQTKYYNNLRSLLTNLLNKTLTVLPSSKIHNLISSDPTIISFIAEHGTLTSCIAMDKLLVSKKALPKEAITSLWDSIFKFQNLGQAEQLSISDLFHITKTVGIYLKDSSVTADVNPIENILFKDYIQKLTLILETILSFKENKDKGSESCFNNGKFIAGIILNIVKNTKCLTPEEQNLEALAKSFF
ncbi:ASB_HP2_G0053990.mRNA.1.CDS.1 [Saccharomyces cerevisiae]|nr:Bem4p [Saccharomyces cerevisiae YJM1434]AJW15485.1 Bem4p [Saccharomyces cerevisiae YJM1273]CAI4768268.1 CEQ_1a_G0053540.mRNA.1.CDS.1 [Saccharomyces cerevisiae]CAI4801925.1 AVI_1a_G0053560.mRNA.1.CDS.1 [Saccharomyces cerevisiae]CAI4822662.1 BFP_1a_G0053700.mRNA.1.CDS.1 [Saccharomyces cerevisiae]